MNRNLLDFETYLFDLDGTLVNTEPLHHQAYVLMVKHHGFTLSWNFEEYLSHALVSRKHLFEAIYNACPGLKKIVNDGETLRQQKIVIYESLLKTDPPDWMPSTLRLLEHLKNGGKELAIVTNSPRKHVERLHHLPFNTFFKKIITIDDFIHPKPHPAGYALALKELSQSANKALVFEDSLKGVESAQGAGISVLLVADERYKKRAKIPESIHSIPSFSSLFPQ
ncbi:MAG: HAD family hydrolase [Chlamydiia bacterium]